MGMGRTSHLPSLIHTTMDVHQISGPQLHSLWSESRLLPEPYLLALPCHDHSRLLCFERHLSSNGLEISKSLSKNAEGVSNSNKLIYTLSLNLAVMFLELSEGFANPSV